MLVRENPGTRAEIARLVGETYRFARPQIPKMAAALGLDDPAVDAAFEAANGRPLETIFRETSAPLERLRWAWMRLSAGLEALPPFLTAFALTLIETVGALAGAALIILIGLINVLTVGYLAEASARNGAILYGSAYIG